jgi:hypothetical protein
MVPQTAHKFTHSHCYQRFDLKYLHILRQVYDYGLWRLNVISEHLTICWHVAYVHVNQRAVGSFLEKS